jgi:hypothetical protein
MTYEHYGASVFKNLNRENLIPLSKHERTMAKIYEKHPELKGSSITFADLPGDLTREQLLMAIKIIKAEPNLTLDDLLARL